MATKDSAAIGNPPMNPSNDNAAAGDNARQPLSPKRFWVLSVGICLGLFLSMIDSSIVATSLYTIGTDLDSLSSINWVALAYTLAYLGCAVAFARASDVVGRRDAFIAAYILFFAFSLACGFAKNLTQLIAFRSLQGLGGSGLYSLTMIILPETCPDHMMQHVGALIGMVIAGSGVFGPVLGGILTQYANWRWIFWINGPIGFVSLAIFIFSWPSTKGTGSTRHSWRKFDFVGTILVMAAAILVVFAFQNAGESSSSIWSSATFIAPIVVGCLCWTFVVAWGAVLQSSSWGQTIAPAFPLQLFSNRYYAAGSLSTLLLGFPFLLIVFSFPTRAQVVSEKSALLSGLMLLPMLGTTAIGSAVGGKLNSTKNYLFETLATGASLMTIGCGLLTLVGGSEDDPKALGFLAFCGLGFGLSTSAATMLVTVEAPLFNSAAAHGILAQMRILGGSLGISASTVLLREELGKHLSNTSRDHANAIGSSMKTSIMDVTSPEVRLAYTEAFHKGMIIATAIAGASMVVTLMGYRRVRQDMLEQRRVLAHQEKLRLTEAMEMTHGLA